MKFDNFSSIVSGFFKTVKGFVFERNYSIAKDTAFSVGGIVQPWAKTAWVFNVAKWKRPLLKKYFPFYRLRYVPLKDSVYERHRAINLSLNPVFVVWGMIQPDDLTEYAEEFNIPIVRLEDGFFRSMGLGSEHNPPYSLCIDKTGIYFDSSKPSDLESILANYDFSKDSRLMDEARACLSEIRTHGLSKYNEVIPPKAHLLYGPKVKKRILVIGQVEDDQSLLFGCNQIMNNVDLIRLVAQENPDAQIIYKAHPDILAGKRNEISNPKDVADLAEIFETSLTLKDALYEVDRVYTLTSLAGFEALIHGVPVTTIGAPFYSGWGLTDDRQITARRTRKLSLEELFAGAYLLYPKYYDPELRRRSSLLDVIELFKERLSEIKFVTPDRALDRLRPFNFATRNAVSTRYIYNSAAKSIAIVTDTPDSLVVARGFAARGKKVTLLSTRDALANTDEMLLTFEESQNISISSLHKHYSVALSEIEVNSVALAKAFSLDISYVINRVFGRNIPIGVVDALMIGLEDYIYFEALRYHVAKLCLEQFDSVLLIFDKYESNVDVVKSFAYHAQVTKKLGHVYFRVINDDTKEIISKLFAAQKLKEPNKIEESALVDSFNSFWFDLQDERYEDYAGLKECIAVCGNVAGDNYAYLPASMKLVDVLAKNSKKPLLFYSSTLMNAQSQDEVKTVTLLEKLSAHCTVYNGCLAKYRDKYPQQTLEATLMFSESVADWVFAASCKRLPYLLIDIFRPRLEIFIQSLFTQTIFIAENMRIMKRCKLVATSMERSMMSRILTAIADINEVPTIGIQPQIISASPRYLRPAVQRMGVIDDAQVDVYEMLGADRSALSVIGSVNTINRLLKISEYESEASEPPSSHRILFAMQHTSSDDMLWTANALRDISVKHGFEIIVKPHPHQEMPVLHEVRRIFSTSNNVTVLARTADTYKAAATCGIVVGLFSSVLLETAIGGKPVVIAAYNDLHPSVDISLRGLALKALTYDELESLLLDILHKGSKFNTLKNSVQDYLRRNPQFEKPYSDTLIDQFIESALSTI